MHTVGHFLVKVSVISQSGSRYNSDAKLLTTNLLFTAAKLKSIQSPKTPPIMCCCLSLALETALGVSSSNIRLVTGIWMGLSQDFHKTKSLSYCLIPHFHCFLVYMCVCLCVCSCSWSHSLADIYRRVQGGCRITFHRRGPREQWGFLSATWLSVGCSRKKNPLPNSPPGPSLHQNYKGPPTAGSSLCSPSFSQTPRPASISRRYSIHRRRALITKQDYGPCLGTTC